MNLCWISRSSFLLSRLALIVGLFHIFDGQSARADEFSDLADSFGTTLTLMGVKHFTTTNPDGTAINFWTPDSEGAIARSTGLSNPHMAAGDAYGNIYIADKASHAILKLTTDGRIHTFAGTHSAGFNGDGPDVATNLQLYSPNGLFVFPSGVVYLLDPGNHRIRRVDTNGVMTTIVNDPEPNWYPSGRALWVSPDEQLIYYTHEFKPLVVNGVTNLFADGAVVKQWTSTNGIETICSKEVGFRNPANIAVNPIDGLLYVCDRAEEDTNKLAPGLFRIEGRDLRTRVTGNITQPLAADGQLAVNSYIDGPRGIAFRPDGSYFLCGHKDGNVWFVDTEGLLHRYLRGIGSKDSYFLPDGAHPPLVFQSYFAQPRSVTLAPNGSLLVVCNDSGYLFQVNEANPPPAPSDFQMSLTPEGVRLTWTGVFGRGYRVERAFDLQPDSWQAIGAAGGTEGPINFADPEPPTHVQCFYRLLPAL
jgi:DNA-binding beta-propeller fold protein YncE